MQIQPAQTTMPEIIATFQDQLRVIEISAHQAGLGYNFLLMAAKRQFIIGALARNNWNQLRAAADLSIHRNTLSRTMAELKIAVPDKAVRRYDRRRERA
jgi:Fis family transcriptional regulator